MHRSLRATIAVLLLPSALGIALARSASNDLSVTVDEFGYIPDGLGWLSGVTPRVPDGNPPFFKMLSALPAASLSPVFDTDWIRRRLDFWTIGRLFAEHNRASYHALVLRARTIPLLFLGVTCLLTGLLSWQLYGRAAAVAAAGLTALNPNVLAHGALVTPDIFFTAGILASLVAFHWYAERPSYGRAAVYGGTLGIACLFKLTGLVLVVAMWVWSLVERVQHADSRRGGWCDTRFRTAAAASLWLVLCAAYGFEGMGTKLRDINAQGTGLSNLGAFSESPAPLPVPLLSAIEFQLGDRGYLAYLDGRISTTGFWDYYLRALLYKTPPALLALALLASLRGRVQAGERALVVTALASLAVFSIVGLKNIGVRYVLFLYPLMAVWASRLLSERRVTERAPPARTAARHWRTAAVCLGLAGMAISEWRIWPHHLAYFTALSGGPERGPEHLADSNVDWGQGLIHLKSFMDDRGIDRIELAYFGGVDPSVYGIRHAAFGELPGTRWRAVSATVLYSYSLRPETSPEIRRLLQREPAFRLGYSIYVYDMDDARPRRRTETPPTRPSGKG
jgi:hypothetical protein